VHLISGHKRYKCSECNSRFKTKDELKQHGISHTTGKPYRCSFCSMKFKYQASLKRHEKKGRCKIGKHWCPVRKRKNDISSSISEKSSVCSSSGTDDPDSEGGLTNFPSLQDHHHQQQQPLFCDVFLGWKSTGNNVIGDANSELVSKNNLLSSTSFSASTSNIPIVLEPLFSF